MFRSFLALFLASALAPGLAFAESASSPCSFVDKEASTALKLNRHDMKVVQAKVPPKDGGSPKILNTCTFTPSSDDDSPSISVTTMAMPAGHTLKSSCSEKSAADMEFTMCNAIVGNTMVSFVLTEKSAQGGSMKTAFPAEFERLIKRLSNSISSAAATQ